MNRHHAHTSRGGTGHERREQPPTFRPNEFPRQDIFVPGVGLITANGMDVEVLAEIKAAGLWPSFQPHMKIGQTVCTTFRPREGGRVSVFLFVGDAQQGGFISMSAQDSPRAREALLNMALLFSGRPVRMELREGGAP